MAEQIDDDTTVDGDSWVFECPECNSAWAFDQKHEAEMFHAKHRNHTGHRGNRPIKGEQYLAGTRFYVKCGSCDGSWDFRIRERAEEFFAEHEDHVGHEPDEIVER